jgi:hypothetical protein
MIQLGKVSIQYTHWFWYTLETSQIKWNVFEPEWRWEEYLDIRGWNNKAEEICLMRDLIFVTFIKFIGVTSWRCVELAMHVACVGVMRNVWSIRIRKNDSKMRVACVGVMRNVWSILIRKNDTRKLLGKCRHRWDDNIKCQIRLLRGVCNVAACECGNFRSVKCHRSRHSYITISSSVFEFIFTIQCKVLVCCLCRPFFPCIFETCWLMSVCSIELNSFRSQSVAPTMSPSVGKYDFRLQRWLAEEVLVLCMLEYSSYVLCHRWQVVTVCDGVICCTESIHL